MKRYIILLVTAFLLPSCNDSFLEKYPVETQTELTAFKTYENFKTYAWGFYSVFSENKGITRSIHYQNYMGRGDLWAGYLHHVNTNVPNYYASQTATTFSSGTDYDPNYWNYATGGWDFSDVRRVNIMMQNIDQADMTETEKNHWRSVGYFFHSFLYMELVSRYGDVPWIDKVIADDSEDAYGSRNSRISVVDHIMDNLLFAEQNIKVDGDGENTINKACVQVLISRLGLFEGTWRKYHATSESGAKYDRMKLLTESVRASDELMKKYPALLDHYDKLFNMESLTNAPGIILYKEYVAGVLMHHIGRYCRTSEIRYEAPKHTVELYLTKNGLPIHNAKNQVESGGEYCGDKIIYNEFRNRDNRMLMSIVPPYFGNPGYNYTPPAEYNVDTEEYAKLLPVILPDASTKRLPVANFAGTIINQVPNVVGPGQAPLRTYTGYSTFRFYNLWEDSSGQTNTADKPIFHMGEILLNFAEAKWELGQFTQEVADATINKLRTRVGTANMIVADITAGFDPVRDQTVDPVLWEIRRERIVELLCEGFGFDDVRRWKKAPWYINRNIVGCYVRYSDYTDDNGNVAGPWQNIALVDEKFADQPKTADGKGYIKRFPDQTTLGKGWLDKYYLLPLPLNEIAHNPALLPNNPGWE